MIRSVRRFVAVTSIAAVASILAAFGVRAATVRARASAALVQPPSPPACVRFEGKRATLFRGGALFDGDRLRRAGPDADVLVVDGTIAAVGHVACVDAGDAAVDVVDARGATLLPGLIDAHTHESHVAEHLEEALRFGVTTEIDMGGMLPARLAETLEADDPQSADAITAGRFVTAPGGHGTERGAGVPTLARAEDAPSFVAARIAERSAFLKLIVSSERPTLSLDVARAVVDAAHARHRRVVAHVHVRADAEVAVAAGVDGLAHMFLDLREGRLKNGTPVGWDEAAARALVSEIAARSIFVVPTLQMLQNECGIAPGRPLLGDARIAPLLGEAAKQKLGLPGWDNGASPDCYAHARQTLAMMRGKVALLAGTDAGNEGVAHGASLHRELELLVEAGLSTLEALVAATSAPARAFGLDDRGRVVAGARADLVLVDGDPAADILATRAIRHVYRRGVASR